MWTVAFWKAAGERAAATFAEGFLVAVLGAATVLALDWRVVLGGPLLMALVSAAKSVATAALTDGNPSVGSAEVLDAAPAPEAGLELYPGSPAAYAVTVVEPATEPISAASLLEREGYRPDGDGIGRHGAVDDGRQ